MRRKQAVREPITEFVNSVKEALKGDHAAVEIRNSVTSLLKSYGIQTPVQK